MHYFAGSAVCGHRHYDRRYYAAYADSGRDDARMADVPATIESVELQSAGQSAKKVVASYTYTIEGKQYTGHRVSLYGPDNLGTFYEDVSRELHGYLARKTPYPGSREPQGSPRIGPQARPALDGHRILPGLHRRLWRTRLGPHHCCNCAAPTCPQRSRSHESIS